MSTHDNGSASEPAAAEPRFSFYRPARPRAKVIAISILLGVISIGGAGSYYLYNARRPSMASIDSMMASGRSREALLLARGYVGDHQRDPAAYLVLGKLHERTGDTLAALRDYERALSLGADRQSTMLRLGPMFLSQKRYKDVLDYMPRQAREPDVAATFLAFRSKAELGLGLAWDATVSVEAALKLSPSNGESLTAAARIAFSRKDPTAAAAIIARGVLANPDNVELLMLDAQIRADKGDRPGALLALDHAVAIEPNLPRIRLARALLLMASGEDQKAGLDVRAALTAQQVDTQAVYLAGVLALRQGRFDEATDRFDSLKGVASRFPRLTYFQALTALGKNLIATALENATRYVNNNPGDPDGIRLLARLQTADSNVDRARRTLADAIAKGLNDPLTLELYGLTLSQAGDATKAGAVLQQVTAAQPDNLGGQLGLASVELQQGKQAESLARLEALDSTTKGSAAVLEQLAAAQISAGLFDKATATIERLRAKGSQTEAIGVLTGMLAMARLNPSEAVAALQATVERYPNSVTAQLDLAKALAAMGKRGEARARLAALLAKQPAQPDALSGFVQLAIDDQLISQAIPVVEAARKAAPSNDGIAAMLADLLVRTGNVQGALTMLKSAETSGRFQPTLLDAKARTQLAANDDAGAETTYGALIAATPDPQASLSLANLLQKRGAFPEAKKVLDTAIARSPGDFALLSKRVQIEADTAGVDDAVRIAQNFERDPAQMPAAALLTGDVLMRAARPADAVRRYQAALQASRSDALRLRIAEAQLAANDPQGAANTLDGMKDDPKAALLLSRIDMAAQRWPEAARNLEVARRALPDDPGVLNNLAWCYQSMADPRGLPIARRAFLLDPSIDNADTLGWVLTENGFPNDAVKILQDALRRRAGDPGISYHLALALNKLGQNDEAARVLTPILAGTAPFDSRDMALRLAKVVNRPQ